MEYIVGIILIALMVVGPILGWLVNAQYSVKYGSAAINWMWFAAQCVFALLTLFTLPNPDPSGWFITRLTLTILSYAGALISCYKQSKALGADRSDVRLAMIAQEITPLGVALILLIIFLALCGAFSKSKKE